jgi:hypothetical protein
MCKYFPIYVEAVSHIWLCNCSMLNFLIYEENSIFSFISVMNRHYWPLFLVWKRLWQIKQCEQCVLLKSSATTPVQNVPVKRDWTSIYNKSETRKPNIIPCNVERKKRCLEIREDFMKLRKSKKLMLWSYKTLVN